jgi:hypothetical protein
MRLRGAKLVKKADSEKAIKSNKLVKTTTIKSKE